MQRDIPERDWRVFKELRLIALARLCDRILADAKAEIDLPNKSSYERYLSLFKLIQDRDDDVARTFNDLRRSTAFMPAGIIHGMGLFTEEELQRFSPETIQVIQIFAPSSGAR
jgi:hypothetical protein